MPQGRRRWHFPPRVAWRVPERLVRVAGIFVRYLKTVTLHQRIGARVEVEHTRRRPPPHPWTYYPVRALAQD